MRIMKCKDCQEKDARIIQLETERRLWIEMCNDLATENDHLHSRTLYGIVKRTMQILRHVRLP